MNLWQSLRIAIRALGRNKVRTALTMLGIIIGVGAVITMLALGAGATARVTASISAMGTNLLTVIPGSGRVRFGPDSAGSAATISLTEDDAKAIADHFPQTIANVAPTARSSIMTKYGAKSYSTSATGVTPEYKLVNNAPVTKGRFISQNDVDGRLKVAVLGTTVIEQLTGSADSDIVGSYIQINRLPFRVIGVLKTKGSTGFQDQDDTVLIPVTTALRRVFNRTNLSSISIQATSESDMDLATEQISRLLRERHHILPPYTDNDDFSVRSQTEMLEMMQTATGTMTNLLAGIAVVSLIVGGIGIMNIMLVSVSERTREIGLRKAVGATNHDIMLQFMIESCVIAGVGGIIGAATGALGAQVLGSLLNTSSLVTTQSVVMSVVVASAIGLFFGIYPARKAAHLNPIEALRYE